jgi:hypothetical protein
MTRRKRLLNQLLILVPVPLLAGFSKGLVSQMRERMRLVNRETLHPELAVRALAMARSGPL